VTTGWPPLRSDGRTSTKMLSPVVFGFACVPWKWMLPVLEPWKQSVEARVGGGRKSAKSKPGSHLSREAPLNPVCRAKPLLAEDPQHRNPQRPFRNRQLGVQLIEQRLGLLQVQRVKALGEPAVDRSEKFSGLFPLPLIAPQPRHQRCMQACGDRQRRGGNRSRTLATSLGVKNAMIRSRLRAANGAAG